MWIMWTSTVVHRPMFRHKCVWERGNKGYLVGGDLTILKSMSSSMGGMTSIFYYGNKTWSKPPTRVYISGRNDLSNLLPRTQHSVVPHRLWGFQYWGITNGVSVVRVVPYRLWRFSATSERGRPRRSKTKLVLQSFCRLLIYIYIYDALWRHTLVWLWANEIQNGVVEIQIVGEELLLVTWVLVLAIANLMCWVAPQSIAVGGAFRSKPASDRNVHVFYTSWHCEKQSGIEDS